MLSAPFKGESDHRHLVLSLCVIIAVGLLTYANTFNVPFVFDDITNIVENPYIILTDISIDDIVNILKSRSRNRPLANATIAMNFFFHQHQVTGYHVMNLLVHVLTAMLVFLVTRETMPLCHIRSRFLPLGAALLWMANPVQTQSVTYVVQRMTSLAACFYLLSLYCYIKARYAQSGSPGHKAIPVFWFIACGFSMILGFASKETTALLPLFLLLYEWFFFQNLSGRWIKHQARGFILLLLVFALIATIYLRGDPAEKVLTTYTTKPFTIAQRLLTEPEVIIYYISLFVFPHPARLHVDYDFPLTTSLSDPVTVLVMATLIILVFAAIRLAGRHRLFAFAVLWFLGNLVIESSFLGLAIIYEHRLYLPSVFPTIAFVYALSPLSGHRSSGVILILIMMLCSGIWTFQRNTVWQSKVDLWLDNAGKAPGNPRPFNHLGLAWARSGRNNTLAIEYLNTALRLSQDRWGKDHSMTAMHHYNLGEVYRVTGKTDRATDHYLRALALLSQTGQRQHPGIASIYNDLGTIQKTKRDFAGAIAYYNKALQAIPEVSKRKNQVVNIAGIYNNLGIVYAERGDYAMADKHLEKALALLQAEFGGRHPYARRIKDALQALRMNRAPAIE